MKPSAKPFTPQLRPSAGLTLIELMVVLLLLGIVLGIGAPSMRTVIEDNRLSAQRRVLLGALNLARSEAVHRNKTITLSHNSATAGDWSDGLRIYTDEAAGGNTAYDSDDDVLIKEIDSFGGNGITVKSSEAGENHLSFRPNGMLNESGKTVTFAICDGRGATEGTAVTVSLSGRADVSGTATCDP
ncbi:GspH/FimT family protein [Gilvimarinus sp. F26214L]|uniref:GspH/FimT family protein n=1 Tax=Gilvimarinus sp. DZF01 TaxID=3461371 RepID=UPI004045739A